MALTSVWVERMLAVILAINRDALNPPCQRQLVVFVGDGSVHSLAPLHNSTVRQRSIAPDQND